MTLILPSSLTHGGTADAIDVALVVPLSGPAGMFGPSCEACAELAAKEINEAGGILDRPVRLHPVDAGAPLPELRSTIDQLVRSGSVDGVVGWHLSNARNAITPATAGKVPYVYTAFYEGGEDNDGVYMVGETPEQQLFPALRWLRRELGVRRWCVVGNDYVWPRGTARAAREFMADTDLDLVGEVYLPLGSRDFDRGLNLIRNAKVDGVLVFLVGADCAAFNQAFAEAGFDDRIIRLSMMIGEDVLSAGGAASTRGLYTACGYIESIPSESVLDFGQRYQREFGLAAPALNNIGESCHEGLLLLAALAAEAGSLDVRAIERGARRVSYAGPRGEVRVRGAHTTQPVFLADADAMDFSLVADLTG